MSARDKLKLLDSHHSGTQSNMWLAIEGFTRKASKIYYRKKDSSKQACMYTPPTIWAAERIAGLDCFPGDNCVRHLATRDLEILNASTPG